MNAKGFARGLLVGVAMVLLGIGILVKVAGVLFMGMNAWQATVTSGICLALGLVLLFILRRQRD